MIMPTPTPQSRPIELHLDLRTLHNAMICHDLLLAAMRTITATLGMMIPHAQILHPNATPRSVPFTTTNRPTPLQLPIMIALALPTAAFVIILVSVLPTRPPSVRLRRAPAEPSRQPGAEQRAQSRDRGADDGDVDFDGVERDADAVVWVWRRRLVEDGVHVAEADYGDDRHAGYVVSLTCR